MPSLGEIQDRIGRICAMVNREGGNVTSEVTYEDGVKVIIEGTNVKGQAVTHPLSCGHFHTTPDVIDDYEFWEGAYDAIETLLHGDQLSFKQAGFIPGIGHILNAIAEELGADGIFGIIIVTMDDLFNSDMPKPVRDILKKARPPKNPNDN